MSSRFTAFRFLTIEVQSESDDASANCGSPSYAHSGASLAGIAVALPIEYRKDRSSSQAIGRKYVSKTQKSSSQKLYDRALSSLPGGNTRTTVFMKPYPIYAARGEGCRVWDVDGNDYIDCINNFTSLIHGHAHPRADRGGDAAARAGLGVRDADRARRSSWRSCSRRGCRRSSRCGSPIPAPKP